MNISEETNKQTNQSTVYSCCTQIETILSEAEKYRNSHEYEKAAVSYEKAAELFAQTDNSPEAQNCYAYAAIMKEHTEKWRYISYLWYKASGNISSGSVDYKDFNSLYHSYPTISFEKWNNYSAKEKIGRAYQYSAYSEDNYNGPTDSYWLYEKAVSAYKDAKIYHRMIECLISATNRYVRQYNKLSDEVIDNWKFILRDKKIVSENRYIIMLSFEEIYKTMTRYDSKNAKFFYIESQKLRAEDDRINKRYISYIKMKLWYLFSTYNTNAYKIVFWSLLIVLILFPLLFICSGGSNNYYEALRISINNFLGIQTISEGYICFYFWGIVEVLFSYFILVIISTYMIEKVVKKIS